MNRGYIRVWRKIEDSGVMDNPEVCRLFLYLLLKAAAKPRKQMIGNSPVSLEPGQAVVGRKTLAATLRTTEGKIRSSLAALQKMGIINQRPTNKFTVVSIVNWGRYQNQPDESGQRCTATLPATVRRAATDKNGENTSTYENPILENYMALKEADSAPAEFTELRAHYDKHAREEAPGAGIFEYRQLKAARAWPGLAAIFEAVGALAAHDSQWKRGYVPGLAKFLREHRWKKKPSFSVTRGGEQSRQHNSDATILANLNTAARVLASRNKIAAGEA